MKFPIRAEHLIAALFVLSVAVTVQAEIYKWTDGDGNTRYTDAKPQNPSSTAEELPIGHYPYPVSGTMPEDASSHPAAPHVEIYVTSWCPYCKKALAFLQANRIPYTAYDIEYDSAAAARKNNLDPSFGGIPLTVVNGNLLRGFDEDTYASMLLPQNR